MYDFAVKFRKNTPIRHKRICKSKFDKVKRRSYFKIFCMEFHGKNF